MYVICYNEYMKTIPLTKDKTVKVDDDDYQFLSKLKWCINSSGYAKTSNEMYMHRMILGVNNKFVVDHINGDKLDNQRHNIRITNQSVNACNTNVTSGASSYRGVYLDRKTNRWVAQFRHKHVGMFSAELEAAKAYQEAKTNYLRSVNAI